MPTGPEKYVRSRDTIVNIFGIAYFNESLAIQDPVNKLMDKKCNQNISKNDSFE